MTNLCPNLAEPPAPPPSGRGRADSLEELRQRIAAIECGVKTPGADASGVRFGLPALDALLPPGGLPRAALHEVLPAAVEWDDGPALGFTLALLTRLMDGAGARSPLLWLATGRSDLHAPALGAFGIDHRRLLHVRCPDDGEALWAMEEALQSAMPAAVVGEVGALPRVTAGRIARRLQLAAEAAGRPALLLHRPRRAMPDRPAALVAASRWRVAGLPARQTESCWRLELLRCRGGRIAMADAGAGESALKVEWNDATGDFALAAPLRDRQAAA